MSDMKIPSGAAWPAYPRQTPADGQQEWASSAQREQTPSLAEMIREAREKAQEHAERLKVPKNPARYGDAPMQAYARLRRARNRAEVGAATGYARRQIAQLRTALRQDPENAERIRAAIGQLQKAVARGGKKNRELDREKLLEARRSRAQREKKLRRAQCLKQELQGRRVMRVVRESGYLRETEIENRMQSQLAATRMELRAQAQSLAGALEPQVGAAVQQYAAQSAPAPADTGGEVDIIA